MESDDANLAELNRLREKHSRPPEPKPVSDAVLQSLNKASERMENASAPVQRIRRLAALVKKRVACPHFDQVCANRAAEYVVYDGLPESVLYKLFDELDYAAKKGNVRLWSKETGGGRGGWFNGVLKRRLEQYEIAERKKKAAP